MKTNKKKGISLIVLIITIVVMVILAGAIILALTDDDIINNSKEAVNKSDFSNLKEAAQTQYGSWQLAKKLNKTDKDAEEYVKDKLTEQGFSEAEIDLVEVDGNGILNVYPYPEIPEGFTPSIYQGEDTVPGGLVIYKTDAKTLATKTQAEAQTTYDQFVWVPVLDMSKFERTEWNNNIPTNTILQYYTEPSFYQGSTANRYPNEVEEYNAMKSSVEKYGGFYIARYEAGDGAAEAARTTYTTGAQPVVSIKGAYIYNYVGWGKSIKDITSDIVDSSNNNKGKGAVYLSQNMYSANNEYTTNLIYGVQWDSTLRWLSDKYNVTDSGNWGNYGSSTGAAATNSGSSNMNYTTGRNEAWKAKNIYDFAGNVKEWTMEANVSANRVSRGSTYNSGTGLMQGARRDQHSTYNAEANLGFRVVLYLD